VRLSATLAAAELLRHGVTCFIDPGNYHPEASVEGVMATGIRMIVSRSSFDLTKSVLGTLPERMIESTELALERAAAVLERHAKSGNPRLAASASFRGLNSRRAHCRPQDARRPPRHAAPDPRLLFLFDP
jgi:cytosine/adenosine deaminase-related metal-dependent hydrolase